MKRLLMIAALICMQAVAVLAQEPTSRVNSEKVKMFRQPNAAGEVMRLLNPDDEIIVMRKQNQQWTLVQIEGEAGYVASSYLRAKKNKKATAAKAPATLEKSAKL
ncbi:hypothetical protein [Rufibacter immobilis]|uniref:hypothetical protein n=1 Tax=Rufibacter immobilis TaxID=1348778 RepID=UPI0035EC41F7